MPISDRPWGDFTSADYTAEQYCRAALVDMNPRGEPKTKGQCHLPVLEPDGALNRNGVHAAAARLSQTAIPPDAKRRAARALLARYRELDEDPPESIRRLAGV